MAVRRVAEPLSYDWDSLESKVVLAELEYDAAHAELVAACEEILGGRG